MLGRPLIPCIGCGAPVPDTDGATHRCFGASPGCRAAFGEVLAKEYGEYAYPGVHGLTVDAYAVQHQGRSSRQTIQSLAIHLVGLYVLLERGYILPCNPTTPLGGSCGMGQPRTGWSSRQTRAGSLCAKWSMPSIWPTTSVARVLGPSRSDRPGARITTRCAAGRSGNTALVARAQGPDEITAGAEARSEQGGLR